MNSRKLEATVLGALTLGVGVLALADGPPSSQFSLWLWTGRATECQQSSACYWDEGNNWTFLGGPAVPTGYPHTAEADAVVEVRDDSVSITLRSDIQIDDFTVRGYDDASPGQVGNTSFYMASEWPDAQVLECDIVTFKTVGREDGMEVIIPNGGQAVICTGNLCPAN